MDKSRLLINKKFIPKGQFRVKGFLGSGGLAKFRNTLWAATLGTGRLQNLKPETLAQRASTNMHQVMDELNKKHED